MDAQTNRRANGRRNDIFRTALAACVIALHCLKPSASAVEAPPNLVSNAGFEDAEAGHPRAWSCPPPVYTLTATKPRGGKYCLRFENANPDSYVLSRTPVDLKVGSRYEFGAWVRTRGIAGEDSGATVCIEYANGRGRYLGGSYPKGVKGTTDEWRLVAGVTGQVPPRAARVTFVCYVRKHMTGTAYWDDVYVKRYYPPLVAGITTNRYRNAASSGEVVVRAGLNPAGHDMPTGPGTVTARLTVVDPGGRPVQAIQARRITPTTIEFCFDPTPLAAGTYRLECSATAAGGKQVGTDSCTFRRTRADPTRKAYIDGNRRLVLDGKPFFPLGMYWSTGGIKETELSLYADSAFNCMMPYGQPSREQLDLVHSRGLKVIYSVKDNYAGTTYCPPRITSPADERPELARVVAEVGGHPAIMAWYINDELPLSMLDRLSAHRDWMEELDPGRPTWVVVYQVADVRAYLPSFDIIGTDPYPIPHKPVSEALRYSRMTVDAVFGFRAVWMVPQVFNYAAYKKAPEDQGTYRAPTLAEMRSMAWQCIAAGANGLVFYSWFDLRRMDPEDPFAPRWREVKTMANEIAGLAPVLLSVDRLPRIGASVPSTVAWRAHVRAEDLYIIVANSEPQEATATFALEPQFTRPEPVLGEADTTLAGNTLTVRLRQLGVAVLKLSPLRQAR